MEGACVDLGNDSKATIQSKISTFWNANEDKLKCNSTQFDVPNGNIIKFAVSMKFDEFLTDAVDWNVNLNEVDRTDGMTVLDYIKSHMDRSKGSHNEKVLQIYYNQLRAAGAKHKAELACAH